MFQEAKGCITFEFNWVEHYWLTLLFVQKGVCLVLEKVDGLNRYISETVPNRLLINLIGVRNTHRHDIETDFGECALVWVTLRWVCSGMDFLPAAPG